jgi:hypothetical protein
MLTDADAVWEFVGPSRSSKTASGWTPNLETVGLMRQPVPDPLILPAGGILRFALGSADGARSNIWNVFGKEKTDDVYVGARDTLSCAKLSLHESGKWRRALTSEEAERQSLPDGVDRVMNRWEVPESIADGWIHAVSIAIPISSIQIDPVPLKRPKKGRISFYEIESGVHQVRFDVLIKSASAPELLVQNIHAQVGRIQLPGGGCVWVFATEFSAVDGRAEAEVENLRTQSRQHIIDEIGLDSFSEYQKPVGAGWGFSNDDGRPVIIDLGDLRIAEA